MATENTPIKKPKIDSYDIAKSDETMHLAIDLAKFIKENKLYHNIQGKEFVNVEGWGYAGSRLGILPIVEYVKNISSETELKYEAKVTLLNLSTSQTVGAGFAICSNKEQGKKYYQEFAIASMAQTRAIGKAYRNILAWIIRAAGYEPTPSEEMDSIGNEPGTGAVEQPKQPTSSKPIISQAAKEPQPKEDTKPGDAASVKYANPKQKEEIIRLLNNPVITRQEKTKMLLNINKLDMERADQAIAKLKLTIEEREQENNAVSGGGEAPPLLAPAFPSRVGQPGYISLKQCERLTGMLQSHLFTATERDSILGNIEHYLMDEATANIKWVLEQIPLRKEQERIEAAAELYQVVTQNFYALGEDKARHLYLLCDDGKATTAKYRKLKEEILEHLVETEA